MRGGRKLQSGPGQYKQKPRTTALAVIEKTLNRQKTTDPRRSYAPLITLRHREIHSQVINLDPHAPVLVVTCGDLVSCNLVSANRTVNLRPQNQEAPTRGSERTLNTCCMANPESKEQTA